MRKERQPAREEGERERQREREETERGRETERGEREEERETEREDEIHRGREREMTQPGVTSTKCC